MSELDLNTIPGATGAQNIFTNFIDQNESYGAHVIHSFLENIAKNGSINRITDLGAGSGRDLEMAKKFFPEAELIAVENNAEYIKNLNGKVQKIITKNIEKDNLPFENESVDIVIANQILEHTKEIFWITHEVTRSLKVGGYFIVGVPNIASFHNRLLLLLGQHPTQHKLYSAHVRPFSKKDTLKFMDVCFPEGYELIKFAGSQFYPFPASVARLLCRMRPNMAFSIFFLFRKTKAYHNEFLEHPVKAKLETPFFLGE